LHEADFRVYNEGTQNRTSHWLTGNADRRAKTLKSIANDPAVCCRIMHATTQRDRCFLLFPQTMEETNMDNTRCDDNQDNKQIRSEADQARGALANEAVCRTSANTARNAANGETVPAVQTAVRVEPAGQTAEDRRVAEIAPPPVPKHFHVPFPITARVEEGKRLRLGVNILGLVKGGVTLGDHTGGYAGSDVLRTDVRAGVDFSKEHVGPAAEWRVVDGKVTEGRARVGVTPGDNEARIGAGVDVKAIGGVFNTGHHAGVEVGDKFGPYADTHTSVGPAGYATAADVNLSDAGLRTHANAGVGIDRAIGVEGQGRAGIGRENEAHGDVRAYLGHNAISVGAGLYPQVRPDAYVRVETETGEKGAALYPPRTWNTSNAPVDGEVPTSAPAVTEAPAPVAQAPQASTVEVYPAPPPPTVEAKPLPPADAANAEPRGDDGLTMAERAAAYRQNRAWAAETSSRNLDSMFSNGNATSKDMLTAVYNANDATGLDHFTFTDKNGHRTNAQIERVDFGLNSMINIFALDAHGHKQVMLRGVQDWHGNMVQQHDKTGQAVSFESAWWQKQR
jgi:hypothetical protein